MTTVLVLGGLAGDRARLLLPALLSSSSSGEDSSTGVSFVRVSDKHLLVPSARAFTTYIDSRTADALQGACERRECRAGVPRAEYVQANLLSYQATEKVFRLPDELRTEDRQAFDWVFDFTAEATEHDHPSSVHAERLLRQAILLGQAAKGVKAYVRTLAESYSLPSDHAAAVGAKDAKEPAVPWGTRAIWGHEAARALANVPGLNVVFVRPALLYGPYTVTGLTPRALLGEVYKMNKEKLEFLWKPELSHNMVHADDFASALLAAARWAAHKVSKAQRGDDDDDEPAASQEELKSAIKPGSDDAKILEATQGSVPLDVSPRAPVFNVVDDGATTQQDIAGVIERVIGVKTGFHGTLVSQFARLNLADVADEANEKHLDGWARLVETHHSAQGMKLNPAISPRVPADVLAPHPIRFDSRALKELTGWAPAHLKLHDDDLRETITHFQDEGHWPRS